MQCIVFLLLWGRLMNILVRLYQKISGKSTIIICLQKCSTLLQSVLIIEERQNILYMLDDEVERIRNNSSISQNGIRIKFDCINMN